MADLLLISNSTVFGRGYLDHVADEIRDILADVRSVLFFPYALQDADGYAAKARHRFQELGFALTSIHEVEAKARKHAIGEAEALFVGGGNTFRLLHALYRDDSLEAIRTKFNSGIPYIGSSAGSIVAGPTIKTTKDMPILYPPSFDALGIFPFQISPHYLDPDPSSTHMGETQEERILQFLEENVTPVIGLREGSWIRQQRGMAVLNGTFPARIFRRGNPPQEAAPGSDFTSFLVNR